MAERPDARELLAIARETLTAAIPDVDAAHHYALRMVARAMDIAAREWGARGDAGDIDRELLARVEACGDDDVEAQRALHAALVLNTRAKLAVSNPRAAGA